MDANADGSGKKNTKKRANSFVAPEAKKPCRPTNPQSPHVDASKNAASDVAKLNFDRIRDERRTSALNGVCSDLPLLIDRIDLLVSKSRDVADQKRLSTTTRATLSGPATASMKRSLGQRIDISLADANHLLQDMVDLKAEARKDGDQETASLLKRAERLRNDARVHLLKYKTIRSEYDDAARESMDAKMNELRLILDHPLRDKIECKQNPSHELQTDFVNQIQEEFSRCLDIAHQVSEWIMMAEKPEEMISGANADVRLRGLELLHELRNTSEDSFESRDEYEVKLGLLQDDCLDDPFSLKKLALLDRHVTGNEQLWRHRGRSIVDLCVRVTEFIKVQLHSLDSSGNEGPSHIYM